MATLIAEEHYIERPCIQSDCKIVKLLYRETDLKCLPCFFVSQYTEDPTFDRHGLTPVTVLEQATSGLAHLHSLNIGKMMFLFKMTSSCRSRI